MVFGGYDAFDDPYAYKGTSVLKNKLGIRDAAVLSAFEVEMSTLRAQEPLPAGRYGPHHYCRVHHHLFQDVYAWAGRHPGRFAIAPAQCFHSLLPEKSHAPLPRRVRLARHLTACHLSPAQGSSRSARGAQS